MKTIPALVCKLAHAHEAWIVSSAADPKNRQPRDWDVLVPFAHWKDAAMLIPKNAVPNTFGGWKIKIKRPAGTVVIDVWPGDLAWVLTNSASRWAWHPRTGVRIQKVTTNAHNV